MDRPYRRLVNHPDFEIPVPSRVSVIGFLVVWGISVTMVAGLAALASWIRGTFPW